MAGEEDEDVLEMIEDNADFKFLLNKKKLNRFELDLIMNN